MNDCIARKTMVPAALLAALLMFVPSASAETYYVYTGQTGAQTQIDVNHTSTWSLAPASTFLFGGGIFNIKEGSATTANITLSLYLGVDASGTLLNSVTLGPGSFTQSFTSTNFFFASPVALTGGTNYFAALTSSAVDAQSTAYFIKGAGNVTFPADATGNPVPNPVNSTPEPGSWVLFSSGLGGLLYFARRRNRRP